MSVAIVVLETLAIPYTYLAPVNQSAFGGDWGNSQVTVHLEVPEGLDPMCLMAVRADDGTITLQEDPAKVAAKTQTQWTSVRAQQRDLLYKSDWTCSVTDYEVPNKADWVTYRAALRDVTKQTDPFAIVWPSPPSSA
jgi:Phage tail assembly chaperone protein